MTDQATIHWLKRQDVASDDQKRSDTVPHHAECSDTRNAAAENVTELTQQQFAEARAARAAALLAQKAQAEAIARAAVVLEAKRLQKQIPFTWGE